MQTRQAKRDKIEQQLKNMRQTIVTAFKQRGRVNKTNFGVQTVAEYKQERKDKGLEQCPKKNGEAVGWEWHEAAMHEVVYARDTTPGRWALSVESHEFTKNEETVDDGSKVLRAGQLAAKFDKETKKTQNSAVLEGAKVKKGSPRKGSAGGADDETKHADTESGSEDSGDSHGSLLESGEDSDGLLGSLGGARAKSSGKRAGKSSSVKGGMRAGSRPKPSSAAAAAPPAKKRQSPPRTTNKRVASPSGSPVRKRRKNTDKAEIPKVVERTMDKEEYLMKDGVNRIIETFDLIVETFYSEDTNPFDDEALNDKMAAEKLQALDKTLESVFSDFSPLYWKLDKRTNKPAGVHEVMVKYKSRINAFRKMITLLIDGGDQDVDIVAFDKAFVMLKAIGVQIPKGNPAYVERVGRRSNHEGGNRNA
jgi:hypothetical protein